MSLRNVYSTYRANKCITQFSHVMSAHLSLLLITCLTTSACQKDENKVTAPQDEFDFGESVEGCVFDQDNDYSSARSLRVEQAVDGFICPLGDSDWYQLSLEQGGILGLKARMETDLSPLNLSYEVYRIQDGETREIVAQPSAVEASTQVMSDHCMNAGDYGVRVFDLNGDSQDKRSLYSLEVNVTPEPDQGELDDEGPAEGVVPGEVTEGEPPMVNARPLVSGEGAVAYIACRGDIDWYEIELDRRSILNLKLEMERTTIQPQVTLYDPSFNRIVSLSNPSAAMNPTDLTRDFSLTNEGRYFFSVEDISGLKSDLDSAYTLTVTIRPDTDLNEPNNLASLATPLAISALECGDEWSPWLEFEGVVGTLGDIDWFSFETVGCEPGLLEVDLSLVTDDLSMNESFELQQRFGLSVSLVNAHEPSGCDPDANGADESCRLLSKSCSSPWDCAGISLVCLPEGVCAGSTACLPSGRCAATQIERHYELPNNATELAIPPHRVTVSTPIKGDMLRYLRVSEFGGNAADPRAKYSLKLRLRREPDQNEPSNIYTDEIRRGDRVADHISLARRQNVVLIHDCSEGVYAPLPPEMSEEKEAGMEAGTDMAGNDLAGTNMAGADMAGTDMAGTDMAGANMAGADMAGADMAGADMAGAGMAGADMAGTDMAGTDMAGTDIAGTDMAGADMAGMNGEDLTPVNGILPTCCSSDSAQWTEGVISYEDDQDFYSYPHPCPGEDCMVKIYYEVDEGPVDMLWQIYEGNNLWFDPIIPVSELEINAGLSGSFGGIEAGDRCFYAWQGHGRNGSHFYTLSIRDLRPSRDWSTDQRYRFCIEKAGNGCFEPPCQNREQPESGVQDGGCSVPRR